MKIKVLLTTIILCASTCTYAQKFEIGLNGGGAVPVNVKQTAYAGDEGKWSYNASANFHINLNSHLQVGTEVALTHWERTADWNLYAPNNQYLGTKEVNYVLADKALSLAFRFNYVIPFYQQYEDFVRSSLYVGVSAGALLTDGNGSIEYSRYNPNTPAEYRYASRYEYDGGYGTLLGAQIGYSYFFSERLGLNVEFAPKVAWVKTSESRYSHANNTYTVFYLPATIGIRLRFGSYGY